MGKSTVFNTLTGLNQHTGNWAGKTVELAEGFLKTTTHIYNIIDLPGTYSLSENSPEEKVTNNYIKSGSFDCIIIVVDSTSLERNLLLTLQILRFTNKVVVCMNLSDEAAKKGIEIDKDELTIQLGVPVIQTSARNKKGIEKLIKTSEDMANGKIKTFFVSNIKELNYIEDNEAQIEATAKLAKEIANKVIKKDGEVYSNFDRSLDKIFTSKLSGIPIMLIAFALIFWITAYGANIPSELLSKALFYIKDLLYAGLLSTKISTTFVSFLLDGIYTTCAWVVSVMLPPALIFFPLFAIIEDFGYLPRVVFNLDRFFKKTGSSGKQALTMALGFGCNACGVMGCRIMSSKKERIPAMLTNSFIPCNGRLPTLIGIISIFFAGSLNGFAKSLVTTGILLLLLVFAILVTLLCTYLINKVICSETECGYILELPPYRKPQVIKVVLLSLKNKVLYVLSRAILISVPAGAILWLVSNISINSTNLLKLITDSINPIASYMGIDGVILTAFIFSFPANELVFPVMLMAYMSNDVITEYTSLSMLSDILTNNGWTILTAICTTVLCLFHFPCSTTCFAIKKEAKSTLIMLTAIALPLFIGTVTCLIFSTLFKLFA